MKKILLLLVSSMLVCACTPGGGGKDDDSVSVVFLLGDNDLVGYIKTNLNQLEVAFPTKPKEKVYVYADFGDKAGSEAKLYELKHDKTEAIGSTVLESYGEVNSCDIAVLQRVLTDIKKHGGNVKWNNALFSSHGKTWIPTGSSLFRSAQERAFGLDYSGGNTELEIADLATLFNQNRFNTIIFDACFMSAWEVVYQMRNCANTIIASPAEVLAEGLPYSSVAEMFSKGVVDPTILINDFALKFKDKSYTLTHINCSALSDLATFNKTILEKYDAKTRINTIKPTLPTYAIYYSEYVLDYYMFVKVLGLSAEDMATFETLWIKAFPYYLHSQTMFGYVDIQNTGGVTFYPPNPKKDKKYNDMYVSLDWGQHSGFAEFLK